jgi:CheY-like chemotaxis protein
VIGTNQDVTEARQAEQERRRLLARLYEVLEGQHQRLAVDLHDGHVQSLAAMGLTVDQVRLRLGPNAPAPVRALLDQLRDDLSDEVTALRRTIGALRPLVLDQCGLVTAVHDLAHATRSRAALVDCSVGDRLGGEPLDPDVETALFRVAQQALANIEQHAAARHVHVVLERSGSTVSLRVQDDGRGFDPAEVEVLAGHQGFGLTSMRERVQALGGQLAIETGRLLLPSPPGPGTREAPVTRPTVLVADDHRQFRRALVALLELDGFEVVGQAADGADAVALAKQMRPDVVVIDLKMPVLNGLDATRLVRDALPSTPVVVLTAFTGDELERAALAAGATAFVAKDANLEELRAALAAAAAALAERPDPGS